MRAARAGDSDLLHRTVDAVIADERAKHHHVLADRLEQAARENGRAERLIPTQSVTEKAPALAELDPSGRSLDELVLDPRVRRSLREVVEEQARSDLLRSHGLEPRHRILLQVLQGTERRRSRMR